MLETAPPIVVASLDVAGTAREVSEAFLEVDGWLRERGLPAGPWIGLFEDTNDPDTYVDSATGAMRGQVWIPFSGDAHGDDRITVKRIEAQRVATTVHEGDIARIGETVRALKAWIRSEGLRGAGCHRQVYLKVVPGAAAGAGWETVVQIPILA